MGCLYRRGKIWWVKYYRNGKPYCESSKSDKKTVAERLLKKREGEIAEGKIPGVHFDKVTFDDLAKDYLNDYRIKGRKSLAKAEQCVHHLERMFNGVRAVDVTTADVKAFIAARMGEGAANATINRDLSALKRMFSVGAQSTPPKVANIPYIPMLSEENVREGFFEHEEFLAVRQALPSYLRPVVTLAYHTGWRLGEILGLKWSQVSLVRNKEGEVIQVIARLERRQTKNSEARTIYVPKEARDCVLEIYRERNPGCPYVFQRDGRRIRTFRKAWAKACKEAGLDGRLFHDFRRTAVRNMVRSGIPEKVAMMISGHKTRDVFDRYNIVSEGDLREAAKKLEAYFDGVTVTSTVTVDRKVVEVDFVKAQEKRACKESSPQTLSPQGATS